MGRLDGKVAVVTGGGSGIGKGIARIFLDEGCSVVIAARNSDRLEAAAEELGKMGVRLTAIATDVTDPGQVKALFEKTIDLYGRLDILVNNAGAFGGGRIDEITDDTWDRVLRTNVTGTFHCTREAFRIMKEAGGGRIINIGSIAVKRPREHSAPYTTSKAAVWALTQCTALDGREFGISASCLNPGNTLVERRADGRPGSGRDLGAEIMISVEEIAKTALLMVTLPPDTNMLEAVVLPVKQPYIGRG
ncbi:MAG: SDR family oxidoreductase [Desulfobacteraceae bacterium]|nr:MAG: SDR family oxidoreductase [Desulfobacteraceae bacterium]